MLEVLCYKTRNSKVVLQRCWTDCIINTYGKDSEVILCRSRVASEILVKATD